jgi:nucleotidyltransferase/DNA polymerase involved in DNA repair
MDRILASLSSFGIYSGPHTNSSMVRKPHLASDFAACCWIPLFALRCEAERHPEFASRPSALLAPDGTRRLWQVSPLARHAGAKPGMTVSQAIGLCPALLLCEADPVYYDDQFARLLSTLTEVSPVIEAVELGRAYVGTDGLEGLYGGAEEIVEAIKRGTRKWERGTGERTFELCSAFRVPRSAFRLGWGNGKFVSWVAATRARPGEAVIVQPGAEGKFLSSQPLAVLPLDPDTHRRLRQLGLRSLGDLAALPEAAVVSQFGGAGRRYWRLAAGMITEPVLGREVPEPIVAAIAFFAPVAERERLARAIDQLIERALKDPRRSGWRVRVARLRAELEHGASWMVEATLKDPSADRGRIAAPLKTRLEQAPPVGAVERLAVEFAAFVPGSDELQLFARDASAAARAGRRRALKSAAQEIKLRLKRSMLYHVIEVQPWSRLPERRYALIDYEP